MATLHEVVRGQVAEFYGRFRPATGLTENERTGIAAEREQFSSELIRELTRLESPPAKVLSQFREVMREIKAEPWTNKVPTVEAIVARTRSRCLQGITRDFCPACTSYGRRIMWADGMEHPEGKKRGQLEQPDHTWWCGEHAEMASWYTHRHSWLLRGRAWPYPPPLRMLPREVWRAGKPPTHYLEWTDGAMMSPEVAWVRLQVERWLGASLVTEPKAVGSVFAG